MARASEVARRTQEMNTKQDGDIIMSNIAGKKLLSPNMKTLTAGTSADAEQWQERYGELLETIKGLENYLVDKGQQRRQRMKYRQKMDRLKYDKHANPRARGYYPRGE